MGEGSGDELSNLTHSGAPEWESPFRMTEWQMLGAQSLAQMMCLHGFQGNTYVWTMDIFVVTWHEQISEWFLGHCRFHKTLGFLCSSVRETPLKQISTHLGGQGLGVRFNLIKIQYNTIFLYSLIGGMRANINIHTLLYDFTFFF